MKRIPVAALTALAWCAWLAEARAAQTGDGAEARKQEYIEAVTRADGVGMLPWQRPFPTEEEKAFRESMEARKTELLARRDAIAHPALIGEAERERARRTVETTEWGKARAAAWRQAADAILAQPEGYVERMIEEQTPWHNYGFTCPNCVDRLTQEGSGRMLDWDASKPDQLRCTVCDQTYPSEKYPEAGVLKAPRMGQEFTFYLNDRERANMDDRSGELAYKWIGRYPMHMSFSGTIRQMKNSHMMSSLEPLAYTYLLTGDPKYAAKVVEIMERFAHCYRNWLYHDYWNVVADCDPLYAAWHDMEMPLEFKRSLSGMSFRNDTLEKARMMQNFWGGGRMFPSTDNMGTIYNVALAYDLTHDAKDAAGKPVWSDAAREKVERDLFLEWIFTGEHYLGGPGKAELHNNKAPRIYHAMAAAGRVLGLPEYCEVAMLGFEGLRDLAFRYDGFSDESAGYTGMYLGETLPIVERLHGYQWPERFAARRAAGDLYKTDLTLRQMYRAPLDHLTPKLHYIPFEDCGQTGGVSRELVEFGIKRYPEYFEGKAASLLRGGQPSEWALFNLDPEQLEAAEPHVLPEIYYPAWMTAILRNGQGPDASLAALNFSPDGGHRHADNLTLWYMDSGEKIIGDLGYVSDTPHLPWLKTTQSHNLVVVDDGDQRFRDADNPRRPKLEMMMTTPKVSAVEASSDAYGQCSDYRRQLTLVKGPEGRTFLVDIFRVKGGRKHTFRVWSELASSWGKNAKIEFTGLSLPPEPPLPEVGTSLKKEDIYGLRDTRTASDPAAAWQATWSEDGRAYRLWNLTEADAVQASNGPGQESHNPSGRRVRFVDVVREGEGLESVFVAIHEPSGRDGSWAIRNVERLEVPAAAGADAVALAIETAWGDFTILSGFDNEAEAGGVRFQGRLGVIGTGAEGDWIAAAEAATCRKGDAGFEKQPAAWTGEAKSIEPTRVAAAQPAPQGMEALPEGCQNWLLVNDGNFETGFPVASAAGDAIVLTDRFPMPASVKPDFRLPSLRYISK